jgi:hypothetical protein
VQTAIPNKIHATQGFTSLSRPACPPAPPFFAQTWQEPPKPPLRLQAPCRNLMHTRRYASRSETPVYTHALTRTECAKDGRVFLVVEQCLEIAWLISLSPSADLWRSKRGVASPATMLNIRANAEEILRSAEHVVRGCIGQSLGKSCCEGTRSFRTAQPSRSPANMSSSSFFVSSTSSFSLSAPTLLPLEFNHPIS